MSSSKRAGSSRTEEPVAEDYGHKDAHSMQEQGMMGGGSRGHQLKDPDEEVSATGALVYSLDRAFIGSA